MRHRLPIIGFVVVYLVALLLIGFWPTHVDRGVDLVDRPPTSWLVDILGLSRWTAYNIGEFSANVLLFVPLGLLGVALRPELGWRRVALVGASFSTVIEVVQTIARPDRTGSVSDIVANTLGATLGAYAAHRWLTWRARPAPDVATKRD